MAGSKIIKLNLAEKFQELLKEGVVTTDPLLEALNQELESRGVDDRVSRATVGRHLKKVRGVINEDAHKLIQDHIAKAVPEDLAALEMIESQCLAWFNEPGDDRIKRLAEAAINIDGEIDKWVNRLMVLVVSKPDDEKYEKEKKALARSMLAGAMSYFKNDVNMQAQRLAAGKVAQSIIESKLKNAGLLEDDTRGRIVFVADDGDSKKKLPGGGKGLFVVGGRNPGEAASG